MDNKDYKYIQKEFNNQKEYNMEPVKITKQLIDKLLDKYNTGYLTELYYDQEIYDHDRNNYSREFTDIEWEEYKKNYDTRKFNNWCDPYSEGTWGLTNNNVRKMIRTNLNELKKYQYSHPNDIRFYINEAEDKSNIYFYGRDIDIQCDLWFGFYNKEVDRCLKCKKDLCWRSITCGKNK